jgi:hypothetical protein
VGTRRCHGPRDPLDFVVPTLRWWTPSSSWSNSTTPAVRARTERRPRRRLARAARPIGRGSGPRSTTTPTTSNLPPHRACADRTRLRPRRAALRGPPARPPSLETAGEDRDHPERRCHQCHRRRGALGPTAVIAGTADTTSAMPRLPRQVTAGTVAAHHSWSLDTARR